MVYKLLMDRSVSDRILEIESSEQLVRQHASIEHCYYPAVMRVNKQVRNEYTAIVMPRMALNMFWEHTHVPDTSTHQILPKKVLSQLQSFDMNIWINHPLSDPNSMFLVETLAIIDFTDSINSFLLCGSSDPSSPLYHASAKLVLGAGNLPHR